MASKGKPSENKWISVLSTLLAISLAFNIILYSRGAALFPAKKEMAGKNAELLRQVQEYKSEIKNYSGISSKIDKIVADANVKLESKEKEIMSLKREKRAKEGETKLLLAQLDSIQMNYLSVIDSILVEREKTKIVNQRIVDLEEVISNLNARIGYGSLLIGDNLEATPIKKGNNEKKQATAMAKKISEFDVCIDILPNRLSRSGMRNIYYVITSPNAEVIFDNTVEGTPEFFNPEFKTNALYSKVEAIDYNNEKLNICSVIKPKTQLTTGLYVLEVFCDDQKLGMTTFTLR